MKTVLKGTLVVLSALMLGCGEKEEKKNDGFNMERGKTAASPEKTEPEVTASKASERIALDNKGVGPVTAVSLNAEIDPELATQGEGIYNQMCLACHRVGKKFIGPAPNNILERRSPEWVMNMILNPEVMVREDPLAKDLMIEFNGSPMANQGLTEDQARAVLEFFRTLK